LSKQLLFAVREAKGLALADDKYRAGLIKPK
jgi:hypothetical protein